MNYRLSDHAIKQIGDRQISVELIEQVIDSPEQIIRQLDGSKVYQSKITRVNNKTYLIRVFINDALSPMIVISVYLTSKVRKYWE